MKINKQVALALSFLFLSAAAAVAQPQPAATTLSVQEQQEVERLRLELEIRDRVQSEVDRAFSRTTTLLNTLLFILTLFPIVAAVGVFFLRRSVINQIVSGTQNQLEQIREKFATQLEEQVTANLKNLTDNTQVESDSLLKLNNLISEAQAVLGELKEQKIIVSQEFETLRYNHYYDPQIETINSEDQNHLSEFTLDAQSDLAVPIQELDANANQILNANDYLIQGNAYFSEGRYLEANQSYNAAVKIEPNFSEARYNNSRCYAVQYRVNLAIGNLQWAIDIEPNYKEMAKADSAFDAIRSDAQFKKLISE
ncbi:MULTISPECIES: TPR end-of-group domain-containing protein [Cyanophyceae]|uniref:TPR end-of-group domain-containing protein n=1 Tax=Cyanophyceae TaxID=3028117 RepID=UPI0016822F0C|nr:tetratricopeptide repeat protein [Trichocoleus sp. FACHB-69]MBD1935277.1 tetratricopeptide repeat protein [Trichocoleus sp. FACHB-69]